MVEITFKNRTLIDFRSRESKDLIVNEEPLPEKDWANGSSGKPVKTWPKWCTSDISCYRVERANVEKGSGYDSTLPYNFRVIPLGTTISLQERRDG